MELWRVKRFLEGKKITNAERIPSDEVIEWDFQGQPFIFQVENDLWIIPLTGLELNCGCGFLDISLPDEQFFQMVCGQRIMSADYLTNAEARLRGMLYRPLCLTLHKEVKLIPFSNQTSKSGWLSTLSSQKIFPMITE